MQIVRINVLDGGPEMEVVVSTSYDACRLRSFVRDAAKDAEKVAEAEERAADAEKEQSK